MAQTSLPQPLSHNMFSVDSKSAAEHLPEHLKTAHVNDIDACRQDNKQRLKQVRNLEDLIKFKVSTVQKPNNDVQEHTNAQLPFQQPMINTVNKPQNNNNNNVKVRKAADDGDDLTNNGMTLEQALEDPTRYLASYFNKDDKNKAYKVKDLNHIMRRYENRRSLPPIRESESQQHLSTARHSVYDQQLPLGQGQGQDYRQSEGRQSVQDFRKKLNQLKKFNEDSLIEMQRKDYQQSKKRKDLLENFTDITMDMPNQPGHTASPHGEYGSHPTLDPQAHQNSHTQKTTLMKQHQQQDGNNARLGARSALSLGGTDQELLHAMRDYQESQSIFEQRSRLQVSSLTKISATRARDYIQVDPHFFELCIKQQNQNPSLQRQQEIKNKRDNYIKKKATAQKFLPALKPQEKPQITQTPPNPKIPTKRNQKQATSSSRMDSTDVAEQLQHLHAYVDDYGNQSKIYNHSIINENNSILQGAYRSKTELKHILDPNAFNMDNDDLIDKSSVYKEGSVININTNAVAGAGGVATHAAQSASAVAANNINLSSKKEKVELGKVKTAESGESRRRVIVPQSDNDASKDEDQNSDLASPNNIKAVDMHMANNQLNQNNNYSSTQNHNSNIVKQATATKIVVRKDTLAAVDSENPNQILTESQTNIQTKHVVETERLMNIHSVGNIASDALNYKPLEGNILTNVMGSPSGAAHHLNRNSDLIETQDAPNLMGEKGSVLQNQKIYELDKSGGYTSSMQMLPDDGNDVLQMISQQNSQNTQSGGNQQIGFNGSNQDNGQQSATGDSRKNASQSQFMPVEVRTHTWSNQPIQELHENQVQNPTFTKKESIQQINLSSLSQISDKKAKKKVETQHWKFANQKKSPTKSGNKKMSPNTKSLGKIRFKGYDSAEECGTDHGYEMANDICDGFGQMMAPGWNSGRYRQFPRFSVSVKPDKGAEEHFKYNLISLNQGIVNYLAMPGAMQQVPTQIASQQKVGAGGGATAAGVGQGGSNTDLAVRVEDPFDRVLLLKNIDNAILTSQRTLLAENNVLSETMKVVHQRFNQMPQYDQKRKKLQAIFRKAHHLLYPVSEDEAEQHIENTYNVRKTQDSMREKSKESKRSAHSIKPLQMPHKSEIFQVSQQKDVDRNVTHQSELIGRNETLDMNKQLKEDDSLRSPIGKLNSQNGDLPVDTVPITSTKPKKLDTETNQNVETISKTAPGIATDRGSHMMENSVQDVGLLKEDSSLLPKKINSSLRMINTTEDQYKNQARQDAQQTSQISELERKKILAAISKVENLFNNMQSQWSEFSTLQQALGASRLESGRSGPVADVYNTGSKKHPKNTTGSDRNMPGFKGVEGHNDTKVLKSSNMESSIVVSGKDPVFSKIAGDDKFEITTSAHQIKHAEQSQISASVVESGPSQSIIESKDKEFYQPTTGMMASGVGGAGFHLANKQSRRESRQFQLDPTGLYVAPSAPSVPSDMHSNKQNQEVGGQSLNQKSPSRKTAGSYWQPQQITQVSIVSKNALHLKQASNMSVGGFMAAQNRAKSQISMAGKNLSESANSKFYNKAAPETREQPLVVNKEGMNPEARSSMNSQSNQRGSGISPFGPADPNNQTSEIFKKTGSIMPRIASVDHFPVDNNSNEGGAIEINKDNGGISANNIGLDKDEIDMRAMQPTLQENQTGVMTGQQLYTNSDSNSQPFGVAYIKDTTLTKSNEHMLDPEDAFLQDPERDYAVQIAQKYLLDDKKAKANELKTMIDSLYNKEKKYMYVNHHARQDCLGNRDPIFNLNDLPKIQNVPKSLLEDHKLDKGIDQQPGGPAVGLMHGFSMPIVERERPQGKIISLKKEMELLKQKMAYERSK